MADRHKTRTKVRIEDSDYAYICRIARLLAKASNGEPNVTAALRKIIHEHKGTYEPSSGRFN